MLLFANVANTDSAVGGWIDCQPNQFKIALFFGSIAG